MMILKLILIFMFIQNSFGIKSINFCIYNKDMEQKAVCKQEQCGFDLCSTDQKSCENLNNWYMILDTYIAKYNTKIDTNKVESLNTFLENIKLCTTFQLIYLKKRVCSIEENCKFNQQYELRQLLKPSKLKLKQCACSGRLSFKCGINYCSDNKHTCNKVLKYMSESTKSEKQINNC